MGVSSFTAGGASGANAAVNPGEGFIRPEGEEICKSSTYVYSPAFARGGSRLLVPFEVLDVSGGCQVDVDVEHKNFDDTSWSTAGSFSSMNSAGLSTLTVDDPKEEVRLRVLLSMGVGVCRARVRIFGGDMGWRV